LTEKAQNPKPCLISCSVLIDEINQLKKQGKLNADVVYVSKMFHVDYTILETNLRKVIEKTLPRISGKPVLVYGDLCLGPNGEMKQLATEYGMVKVDALNCVDCLLGGKGKVNEADPNHDLMFFDPGMIDFFREAKKKLKQEGMDDEALRNMFSGIKGIVLLDTLGNTEKCKAEIESLGTGLAILEIKQVGVKNLLCVLKEALQQSVPCKKLL
jgi:hypothetical protein